MAIAGVFIALKSFEMLVGHIAAKKGGKACMILFLLAFVAFLIIGIPISVSIGFSAVLGCLSLGYPLVVIGQKMVSGIDSWLLIAIPLFILAGNL